MCVGIIVSVILLHQDNFNVSVEALSSTSPPLLQHSTDKKLRLKLILPRKTRSIDTIWI